MHFKADKEITEIENKIEQKKKWADLQKHP